MNQSNFDIGEVLKASLEKEQPSIDFENIWSKYSKHKRPTITIKRLSVLVAAILLIVVSKNYINSIVKLPGVQENTNKIEMKTYSGEKNAIVNSKMIAPAASDSATARNSTAGTKGTEAMLKKSKVVQPALFDAASKPAPSIVVWKNRTYEKTQLTVSEKELGAKLGEIKKISDKPEFNGEANSSPIGTSLYAIKGKDIKKEIAIKIDGKYYRAVLKAPAK